MPYDPNNLFAKILRGEIPCRKVHEDEAALAFHDIHPAAPIHVLILPKGEYVSFDDFAAHADAAAVGRFFATITTIAGALGLSKGGYRLIANHGRDASQSVPHFHVHLLGGRPLGGLMADDPHAR